MRHASLCVLCVSVVNFTLDDCHRSGLNHRDTEHTEKGNDRPVTVISMEF